MQGIYTYIPETNYVPRTAILLLLFMVLIYIITGLNLLLLLLLYTSVIQKLKMQNYWEGKGKTTVQVAALLYLTYSSFQLFLHLKKNVAGQKFQKTKT